MSVLGRLYMVGRGLISIEQAHQQLRDLLPGKRYREMSQALAVSCTTVLKVDVPV